MVSGFFSAPLQFATVLIEESVPLLHGELFYFSFKMSSFLLFLRGGGLLRLHVQTVCKIGDGLPLHLGALVGIDLRRGNRSMAEEVFYNRERDAVIDQLRCEGMAQCVGVHSLNLAALRNWGKTNLKTLGSDIGSRLGRKQQIVWVRPARVLQGKEMAQQKLAFSPAGKSVGFPSSLYRLCA